MRSICIITNYNYANYLSACLDSVLAQTHRFDCIFVVDDGSSDSSRDVIEAYAFRHEVIVPVFKDNGGQLSCLNAVVDRIEDDDLVFLLDADDIFSPDYLAILLNRASSARADFFFVEANEFCSDAKFLPPATSVASAAADVEITCSSALMRVAQIWAGSPTSALSLRGKLYKLLFPYPFEGDWITRADDVVIFGSSVLGARKLYIPSLQISYRIHGKNGFYGRQHSARDEVVRKLAIERLVGHYCFVQRINRDPPLGQALEELFLIPNNLRRRFQVVQYPWKLLFIRIRFGLRNLRRAIKGHAESRKSTHA